MLKHEIKSCSTASCFKIEVVRRIVFLFVSVVLFLIPAHLFAGRPVLGFGTIHSQDMTIVLATINEVAVAEQPRVDDPKKKIPGFRFRLDFDQFVRPGQMDSSVNHLEVKFSCSGYATNWEFGAKPTDGMKVMAHLKRLKSGKFELHPFPRGIVFLKGFDEPVVEQTRRVCRLWEVRDPAKRLETVVTGCRSGDDWFQEFCVRCLRDTDGAWTGVDLSSVIDPQTALSIIFEPYAKKNVLPSGLSARDNVFWNKFRGLGWEQYEPRYHLLSQSVDKMVAEGEEIQRNMFDGMVVNLCNYPQYGQENYRRLLKIVHGKVESYQHAAAIRFSMIYRRHSTDLDMQRLNDEIFKKLVQLLSHESGVVGEGAAIAIGNIAVDYAAVGPVPEKFVKLMRGETDIEMTDQARSRLDHTLRFEVPAAKPFKLEPDVEVLSYPWDNLIGKKVAVAASTCFRDGQHGASVEFRERRLWIDGLADWPKNVFGGSPIQLTGRLTKVEDIPVFRYEAGKPFGKGLPVPAGYSMEKARTRYVLSDPSWKVLPK